MNLLYRILILRALFNYKNTNKLKHKIKKANLNVSCDLWRRKTRNNAKIMSRFLFNRALNLLDSILPINMESKNTKSII